MAKQPGVPGGAESGAAGNGGAGGDASSRGGRGASAAGGANAGSFPGAVSITGGNGHSGSGGLAPAGRPTHLNLKPMESADAMSAPRRGPLVIGSIDPGMPPERLLSGPKVYSLHIDMPNLTSANGTNWIVNFAQLEEGNPPYTKPKGDLTGLELVRKVDPKYPPDLIKRKSGWRSGSLCDHSQERLGGQHPGGAQRRPATRPLRNGSFIALGISPRPARRPTRGSRSDRAYSVSLPQRIARVLVRRTSLFRLPLAPHAALFEQLHHRIHRKAARRRDA